MGARFALDLGRRWLEPICLMSWRKLVGTRFALCACSLRLAIFIRALSLGPGGKILSMVKSVLSMIFSKYVENKSNMQMCMCTFIMENVTTYKNLTRSRGAFLAGAMKVKNIVV